jgi:hypothetical protein
MSLRDNALIVSLTVGKPQLTKSDATATNVAEKAMNAHNAGQYRKDLYPKHIVQQIRAVESAARGYIESTTYQWARGEYLLPTVRFMRFAERMRQFEIQFDQEVTAFMQNWVNVLDEAKQSQGDLFNADDYPDLSDLRRRFYFNISYKPVADASDFRVALQDDELTALRESVEKQTKAQYEDLMRQPLERLRDVVARLHETMAKPEREVLNPRKNTYEIKPPIFRDTVVDNIIEQIDLLGDFASVLPSEVVELSAAMKESIPSAEELRHSSVAREQTANGSKALLDIINGMLEA